MKHTKIYLVVILIFSLTQCKDKEQEPTITAQNEIEHALYSGGSIDEPPKEKTVTASKDSNYTDNGEKWKCTTTTYDIKDGVGGDGGFPLFNPNANVIYPGSMLQGKSLRNATPDVIAVDRAGGTISYDIIDGSLGSSFTVDEVKKSTITDAMNNIISQASGTVPSNFSFSYTHIQSREQFALEVNADFENAFLELEGKFAMETNSSFSSYLVRLDQQFYTMSFDIPTNKSQLFAPTVTPDELKKYVGPGNPATYISDVTYGRIYYLLIESSSSAMDLEAAISGSFSTIAASGSGSVESSYYSELSDLKVKMFAYGGEASGTLQTTGTLDIATLSTKLAESGLISSGRPLSYVVRNAYDNKVVSVAVATKYDVTTCESLGAYNEPPSSTSHWTGMMDKLGGPVGAIMTRLNGKRVIINKAGTHYVNESNGVVSSSLNPIGNMFGSTVPFDSLGAAGSFQFLQSGFPPKIYQGEVIFNKNGNSYVNVNPDTDKCGKTYSIGAFLEGSCPFNSEGIGAICNYGSGKVLAFNKSGTKYSYYNINGWTNTNSINSFSSGIPFSSVSAATQMKIGDNYYIALFNEAGTQYCIYDVGIGLSPVYDL